MASEKQEYLATAPGDCCFTGSIHSGTPKGTIETLAGVPTYVTHPPPSKANGNVVLYFPDVHGIFINSQLLMDGFAAAGYLVLGIDYFRDDPSWKHESEPNFDREAWRVKHKTFANENTPRWVEEAQRQYGKDGAKFGCVGYCFGAPYVMEELARDIVSAGAFAHPSMLTEKHFEDAKHPLLLSCAETDARFETESRRRAVDILREGKKAYHVQLFYGVKHGFAVRGNMDNKHERFAKEQSLKGIVDWFNLWLSK